MVKIIIGNKGSGKTKMLIDLVNQSAATAKGHVACIEKGAKLTYDIVSSVRLIDTDEYEIASFEELHGFIAGLMAADYDLHDIFLDSTLKIGNKDFKDYEKLEKFIVAIEALSNKHEVTLTATVSADISDISDRLKEMVVNK
ncbi:hypothetical protein [Feifania hominis]|uniref:Twitching motility protein PilT n=1 Tax=Feifania hominis TaxID=2763660 RepID=A0A926DDV2_9FIRM|nr:hypothetical protein [Feifania hominis]MBC8536798.1 hypothetical protein [Feifania hominis]